MACAICVALFLPSVVGAGRWSPFSLWAYQSPDRIWDGAYWALLSSAFIHFDLWHIAFNLYWLWHFGNAVERYLGPVQYLGFVLSAAVVTSSIQVGVSGSAGYGASGIGYALFGFLWASRSTVPAFSDVLTDKTITLFWMWLVGCVVATWLDMIHVGNSAHIAGLIFGSLIAAWLVVGTQRRRAIAATGVLCVAALLSLVWSPWSAEWVGYRAYKAHRAGAYDAAIEGYRKSIRLGGDREWALKNLALAYHLKGAEKERSGVLRELRSLNADAAAELQQRFDSGGETQGPARQ